ncbi:SDR family NAD(P)-dependent oxidoreductase [Niabella beijingensis]|uniref:SDR family NAD(P)-dependent oxidoreductase n=1 Tax=Niabella beijingensis TaxID=2872700 RepID=UPI001CBED777|nr:SDR family oxidoreductase [Niabella beijingensis]MBZ4188707.1 SDR family oxidoreductase [Niabella beijingensis]
MRSKTTVALITGGSRGLGRDMALRLAEKGIDVILTYNSNKTEADHVVAAIKAAGRQAAAFQLDTGDTASFDAFIRQVTGYLEQETGSPNIDFLINNAGIGLNKPFAETSEEAFDTIVNIHFKGVYFLTQKALPFINDGGRIINISSGLARFSFPGNSVYAAAKGAVEVLTRYLAKELGARRIAVNTVAPGAIATDFGGGRTRDNKEVNAQIAGVTALGRAGEAEDIGGVVAFLCSPEAGWINAQRIEVSGGMMI